MRELTIKVVIDESHKGTLVEEIRRTVDGHYTISMDLKELSDNNLKPAIVLAHELGHVIGLEFELPGHKMVSDFTPFHPREPIEVLLLGREHEAWDMAEEMTRSRKKCIRTYEQSVRPDFFSYFKALTEVAEIEKVIEKGPL